MWVKHLTSVRVGRRCPVKGGEGDRGGDRGGGKEGRPGTEEAPGWGR